MDCQPGEKILDLCAALGGKSSHIAMQMKNLGELRINDPYPERFKAIKQNLSRMDVKNHISVSMDGSLLPKQIEMIDKVLVDAQGSVLADISKDKSIKHNRSLNEIQRGDKTKKQLLFAKIDMIDANSKTGGYVIYSLFRVGLEENERIVQYALEKNDVKIVKISRLDPLDTESVAATPLTTE